MPEIASEIAAALHRVAESFETLAGVAAYVAASADEGMTQGEIRQMAACMYRTAQLRFGGVKYDGVAIPQMTIDECDAMWARFFHIDPKKLPKR